MSCIHKLFELQSDIGRLTLEVRFFQNYAWIVITEPHRLQIDGGIQVGVKTPYSQNNKPTVINIAQDQHQVQKQHEQLCRRITNQLNCFVVISINTSELLSIGDIKRVTDAIKQINKSITTTDKQKEQQKIMSSTQVKGQQQQQQINGNNIELQVKNIKIQQ